MSTSINSKSAELQSIAKQLRMEIIKYSASAKTAHIGSCFSCLDILIALYFEFLNISPNDIHNPNRDRFILSKGHAALAQYLVLHHRGILSDTLMASYAVSGHKSTH